MGENIHFYLCYDIFIGMKKLLLCMLGHVVFMHVVFVLTKNNTSLCHIVFMLLVFLVVSGRVRQTHELPLLVVSGLARFELNPSKSMPDLYPLHFLA